MKIDYDKPGWYMSLSTSKNVVVTKYGKTLNDLRWDIIHAISLYKDDIKSGRLPYRYTLKYIGKLG